MLIAPGGRERLRRKPSREIGSSRRDDHDLVVRDDHLVRRPMTREPRANLVHARPLISSVVRRERLCEETRIVDHDAVVLVSAGDCIKLTEERALVAFSRRTPCAPVAVEEVERRLRRRAEHVARVALDHADRLVAENGGRLGGELLGELDRRHGTKDVREQQCTASGVRSGLDTAADLEATLQVPRERSRNGAHVRDRTDVSA
jgi:hypothetical protein